MAVIKIAMRGEYDETELQMYTNIEDISTDSMVLISMKTTSLL